MPKKITRILSSSQQKTTQIIQVSSIPSTKRKEIVLLSTFRVQSKVFFLESNKMQIKRWQNNLKNLRKTMSLSDEIWIPSFTKTKFWQRDWKSWRSFNTTIKVSWRTKRRSKRESRRLLKFNKKLRKWSINMLFLYLNMKD